MSFPSLERNICSLTALLGVAVKFDLPRFKSCSSNLKPDVTADGLSGFYAEAGKTENGVLRCTTSVGGVPVSSSWVQSPMEETSDAYEVVVNIGNV